MFEVLNDSFAYPELLQKKMSEYDFNKKIIDENYRPVFTYNPKKSLKRLVERCWSDDPKKRPNFDEIFEKLSKTDFENEEEEDYLIEEVDTDELNDYVLDITEINDTTEKLLSKIKKIGKQNKQLKKENSALKTENEQNLSKIKKIEKENLQFKETINKIEKENEQLLNEITQLKNINKSQLDETKILNNLIDKLKAEKKDDSERINMILKDKDELLISTKMLKERISIIEDTNNKLSDQVSQSKKEKDNLLDQINQIKAENERKDKENRDKLIEYICNFNLFDEEIPGLNRSLFGKYIERRLDLISEFRRLINMIEQNGNELLYLFQDETNKNDIKDKIQTQITQFDTIIQKLIKENGIRMKFEILDNFYSNNCMNELKTSLIEHFYPLVEDIPSEIPLDDCIERGKLFQDFDPSKNKGKVDFEKFKLIKPPKNIEYYIKDENIIERYDKFVAVVNLIISIRILQKFSHKYQKNCEEYNKYEMKEQIDKMKPEEIKTIIEYTNSSISHEYKTLKCQNKQLTASIKELQVNFKSKNSKIEELEKLIKLERCQIEEEKNKLLETIKQFGLSQIRDRIEGIRMAINSLIFPVIKSHPKKDDIQKFNNQVNQLKNAIDIIKNEILEIREKYTANYDLLINQTQFFSIKK